MLIDDRLRGHDDSADIGGRLPMHKKEIIFFDVLGFGWVVDKSVIQMIHESSTGKEVIVEKTLSDLLGRHQ
jgi:hypothetical protein